MFSCLVRGIPFFIGVLVPVVLILIQNLIVLVLVLRGIAESKDKKKARTKLEAFASVRIAFACSVLLGTTWVFGVLAIGDLRDIFQWLFCIFNSLQGFFIFILYTVRNPEARRSWGHFFGLKGFDRTSTYPGGSKYKSSGKTLHRSTIFCWTHLCSVMLKIYKQFFEEMKFLIQANWVIFSKWGKYGCAHHNFFSRRKYTSTLRGMWFTPKESSTPRSAP